MNPLKGVLGEAWGLYRRFTAHFLAISFVLYFLTAVIVVLLTMTAAAVGYFVAAVIEFIAAFLVQAAMVKAVQDARDGSADLSMDARSPPAPASCYRSWVHPSWPGSASGSAWCSLSCPA